LSKLSEYYFVLRDELHNSGETGYTKAELHKMAKSIIMPMLLDEDDNFDLGKFTIEQILVSEPSTRWLSEKGWQNFIEQFKSTFIYADRSSYR
jgi:hypothetical protein